MVKLGPGRVSSRGSIEKPGSPAMARWSRARRWSAEAETVEDLCGEMRAGRSVTLSAWSSSRAWRQGMRWPW